MKLLYLVVVVYFMIAAYGNIRAIMDPDIVIYTPQGNR